MLLQEAYSVELLKESFPKMTLTQLESKLPNLNISESEYIENFSNRVIEELFGGLKALAGGAKQAVSQAGQGILDRGTQAVKQMGKNLVNTGKEVGSGLASGANQIGQNVRDIYNGAEGAQQAQQAVKQATDSVNQLVQLIKTAQQQGLVSFTGDPMTLPLEDIIDELVLAKKGADSQSKSAQKNGVFGRVGQAYRKGARQ